jgi:hypothetical protein
MVAMMSRQGAEGEISYDLVMEDDMDFVEGTCRVPEAAGAAAAWQVFVFTKSDVSSSQVVRSRFTSGTSGLLVRVPASTRLDCRIIEEALSDLLGVVRWRRVTGPDSMSLR